MYFTIFYIKYKYCIISSVGKTKQEKVMKRLSICMFLCVGALSIPACQKTDAKKFVPELDKNTEGSIMVRGHYENFEALTEEFIKFNAYYPKVEMSYEYDKNHKKNILDALNGDTPPDIFFTYSSLDFSTLDEFTEDLSDPELGFDLTCIRDSLIYKDNNDKVPYLPIYTTSFGMMINENLFKKHNIKVPTTYDGLVKACQDFMAKGVQYPILGHNSMVLYPLYFPHFLASIKDNPTAINALNSMSEGCGEYARESLTLAKDFIDRGFVNKEECAKIGDDYNKTILRFFEGDVPMMLAKGSSFSGTEKRESQSEAYSANPFNYSFVPVPSTDKGGYFYNTVELCFSVNKKSVNLDMANEFIRFLLSSNGLGLNRMAKAKRMITPCKNLSYDSAYAAFNKIDASRTFTPSQIGLADKPDQQVRKAGTAVCLEDKTVDYVITNFATL